MSRQSRVGYSPSLRNHTLPPFLQFCAGQLAVAGLIAIAIPTRPVAAYTEFQICAAQLVRFASVAQDIASVACADALRPEDLSRCAVTISLRTPGIAQDALSACKRVRRPVDLSRCVIDISDSYQVSDSQVPSIMEYCRRSLLPIRFSECVTGLRREVDLTAPRALNDCIAAEDFPRQLFPDPQFAPPPSSQPTQPLIAPSVIQNLLSPTPEIPPPQNTQTNPAQP